MKKLSLEKMEKIEGGLAGSCWYTLGIGVLGIATGFGAGFGLFEVAMAIHCYTTLE